MTEGTHVAAVVEKIALSHPDISIRLIQNNQNKLYTSGNNNLKDLIYTVFGREITSNLLSVDAVYEGIHITGFIGKPVIARSFLSTCFQPGASSQRRDGRETQDLCADAVSWNTGLEPEDDDLFPEDKFPASRLLCRRISKGSGCLGWRSSLRFLASSCRFLAASSSVT